MESLGYMEIGGNHPVQTSSTYLFYRYHGARGVICEANPRLAMELKINRPGDIVVNSRSLRVDQAVQSRSTPCTKVWNSISLDASSPLAE